jgi:hypothetical protein
MFTIHIELISKKFLMISSLCSSVKKPKLSIISILLQFVLTYHFFTNILKNDY